ncbi:MAG: hypothetical protein FJ271_29250 [Planctomycetes bacterium]|nr:hypothetical protein [Planctomycetota bacterium]
MAINISKILPEFLQKHQGQKFTARQMADWIFETYPSECQEKKKNSSFIKTDAELLNQIVAEIGSQRPGIQKKNPQIKTTEGRPRHYYWTEKTESTEVSEAEQSKQAVSAAPIGVQSLVEANLYGLLTTYLWSEFNVHSMRIDEKKSSNKHGPKGNKWLYPDLVAMEDLTASWHQEIKGVVNEYADKKTKLWSFEVKLLLM